MTMSPLRNALTFAAMLTACAAAPALLAQDSEMDMEMDAEEMAAEEMDAEEMPADDMDAEEMAVEESAATEADSAMDATTETPEEKRARLNSEQAAMAAAQLEANAANAKAIAAAERLQLEYQAARAKWEAEVAACQANGTCAK